MLVAALGDIKMRHFFTDTHVDDIVKLPTAAPIQLVAARSIVHKKLPAFHVVSKQAVAAPKNQFATRIVGVPVAVFEAETRTLVLVLQVRHPTVNTKDIGWIKNGIDPLDFTAKLDFV